MSSTTTGNFCYEIVRKNSLSEIDKKLIEKKIDEIYTELIELAVIKPYVLAFSNGDKNVCICLNKKSQKIKKKIEEIHENLSTNNIFVGNGIYIKPPTEISRDEYKWWDKGLKVINENVKWTTLEYEGPFFPDLKHPYIPHKAPLIYKGKKYILSPSAEKVANFYASRLISESDGRVVDIFTKDPVFNKNYWMDFKTYLSPEQQKIIKDFDEIDFSEIVEAIKVVKEGKRSPEGKAILSDKKCKREIDYSYAIVNGVREKIGGNIEPAGIFTGRGKQPNRGRVKPQVLPEHVTINIGPTAPIPKPPHGHKWGGIIHNNNVMFLASWDDKLNGGKKYVRLGHVSQFKTQSDLKKFEIARKLNKHLPKVREEYTKFLDSKNISERQTSTIIYLIDHYGFRPGDTKDKEEEADTVGVTTFRKEHIVGINPTNNTISLYFLGKDSVPYQKELIINDKIIMDNISLFIKDKKPSDLIFDKTSVSVVNNFLKNIDKNFTAKFFRTRLGSVAMADELKKVQASKDESNVKKKSRLDIANAIVAEALNHKRNITEKSKEVLQKRADKLAELQKKLDTQREAKRSTATTEAAIEKIEKDIELRDVTLDLAIHTSRKNYIDPRIFVAWAKKYELPIDKVFQPELRKQFAWAIDTTTSDWEYTDKLIEGMEEKLESSNKTTKEIKVFKKFVKKPSEPGKSISDFFPKLSDSKTIPVKSSPTPIIFNKKLPSKSEVTIAKKIPSSNEVKYIYNKLPQELTQEYIENNRAELFPLNTLLKDNVLKNEFKINKILRKKVLRVYMAFIIKLGFMIKMGQNPNIISDKSIKEKINNENTYITIARMMKFLFENNMKPMAELLFLGICEDCKTEKIPIKNKIKQLYKIIS